MSIPIIKSEIQLKVQFHECDPLQIVWHGNYLKYFEEAREDFCLQHGISYLEVKDLGYATPIVSSTCEHKLPMQYGDTFKVETFYKPTVAAKMKFSYKITISEKLICLGETVQVFLNEKRELVLINPPFFLDWKRKMGLV